MPQASRTTPLVSSNQGALLFATKPKVIWGMRGRAHGRTTNSVLRRRRVLRTDDVWSQLAGNIFLGWLVPRPGLRWIDVGCGSGAFTELLIERCSPIEVHGIDRLEGQLAFARTRLTALVANFRQGDAMALPFPDDRFDAAVMALVIFLCSRSGQRRR